MSVHLQMLGRQLPCNLLDLLQVKPLPLASPIHDDLVRRLEIGQDYPDLHYKLGLSHLGRQELGLARKHLGRAVDLKPQYTAARLGLAAVLDLLAQHELAVAQLDALQTTENPGISQQALLCASGFCLERLGAIGEATFRYQQSLADDDTDLLIFAHSRLSAIYLAHNELEKAVEHHRALLDLEPQEQAVRTSLAHLLQILGRHREAVWEYQKALCMEPDSWELQLELAEQLQRMGDSDQAIDHLRRLVSQHPEFPDLHLRLANLYSSRGMDDDATAEYDQALSIHDNYLDCRIAYARHELRMGRLERAALQFQHAMNANDQNVEAYAGLAVAFHRLGRKKESAEMLAAARRIAGNSDVLLSQLGQLELEACAADQANAAFDPAAQSQPPADAQQQQQERQRKWVEAQIERYRLILQQHPTWTDVRVRCGMLLKLLGRCEDAIACFERATQENPAYAEAWVQLGLTRHQMGDAAGAINALESAIQIKPDWADLHYRLGLIYCGEMEFDLAMERLEEAVSLNNLNPDFHRQLWAALEAMQMKGCRRTTVSQELAA